MLASINIWTIFYFYAIVFRYSILYQLLFNSSETRVEVCTMRKLPTIFIGILCILSGCARIATIQPSQDHLVERSVKEKILREISSIIQITSDQRSRDILNEIQNKLTLATPHEFGAIVREESGCCDHILLIPLQKNDPPVGEMWAEVVSDHMFYAFFLPALQAVAIKEELPYSDTGKILLFLHEAFHANIFSYAPYDIQSDEEYFSEERDAYIFQGTVMYAIGKEKYMALLEKEVDRIMANVKKSGIIPWPVINDLELVFGESHSRAEEEFMQKSFWIHAVFTFLDRTETESSTKKTAFLAQIAQSGWTL